MPNLYLDKEILKMSLPKTRKYVNMLCWTMEFQIFNIETHVKIIFGNNFGQVLPRK